MGGDDGPQRPTDGQNWTTRKGLTGALGSPGGAPRLQAGRPERVEEEDVDDDRDGGGRPGGNVGGIGTGTDDRPDRPN